MAIAMPYVPMSDDGTVIKPLVTTRNVGVYNDVYFVGRNAANNAWIDMFKLNSSDEIELGTTLNVGTMTVDDDSGAVVVLNMPVSADPADGTEESFDFQIDSNSILKLYSEADSAGAVDTLEARFGNNVDILWRASTGGCNLRTAEATVNVTAAASITIACQVPSGARIIGCQIRVDAALAAGETWDAAYETGATQAIATAQAVAQNTKVNKYFDTHAATDIASAATDIAITKNAGGAFTAQGTFRGIIYYMDNTAMASL